MFLVGCICNYIFDPFICAILVTLSGVILTGGLHIDGLGDTFDAIYSYRDKEKMLEIMKDSRLGTNSLLAIVFLVLLKVSFIYSIINVGYLWMIIFMPVVSRLGVILMMYKTKSPRKNGMGNLFIGKATIGMFATAIIYTVILILLIGKVLFLANYIELLKMLISIVVLFIFNEIFKRHIYKKIDGVTGDILGCTIELGEVVYIISIYMLLSI